MTFIMKFRENAVREPISVTVIPSGSYALWRSKIDMKAETIGDVYAYHSTETK